MTASARFAQLTIVGFGLIGGSVAAAARARGLASRIIGVDRPEVVASEAARRLADELLDSAAEERVDRAFAQSDLVMLATPVSVICTLVGRASERAKLVTDCGSTKRAIVRAAQASVPEHFVAGHPMAGDPRSGIEHARPDLFEGRPWILCPEQSDPGAVDRVESFVRALGAEPKRLDAREHDRAVAITSHVPQLLASALSVLASDREAAAAAGPAFESATRVAGGNESMWRDILATNADEVSRALRDLSEQLLDVARGLDASPADLQPALDVLRRARRARPRR